MKLKQKEALKIFWYAISRKKKQEEEMPSDLARILGLVDLVAIGVGATLGLGVYVLAGSVTKTYAGPATCLSFLVGAFISLLGGLCFCEFAARIPRTGYAYSYCYAGVGELVAFTVGWYLILAVMLGTAGVARGMSAYINMLADKKIENTLRELFPINIPHLSSYPDFLGLCITLAIGVLLSSGMQESAIFINTCTLLNIVTILVTIVACAVKADIKNWNISPEDVPPEYKNIVGDGGFLPFGISGVIAGSANCFFGFTGFDAPASCSGEAKNPKRDIPLAILISLFISFLVYFVISCVLTLAWPYYLQDTGAPFPYVFGQFGWTWVKWIVSIGAIFALLSSLFGSMYTAPRLIYTMATDGLIFKHFSYVHPVTKTPLLASCFTCVLTGIMTTFLDIDKLMDLMTIGGLFTYVIVGASLLVLRYENNDKIHPPQIEESYFRKMLNLSYDQIPDKTSSTIANLAIVCYITATIAFLLVVKNPAKLSQIACYILAALFLLGMLVLVGLLYRRPQSQAEITFKVPLVPIIPCLSILFNLYLMMQLSLFVWSGFLLWILVGFLVYFAYGMKHSKENKLNQKD